MIDSIELPNLDDQSMKNRPLLAPMVQRFMWVVGTVLIVICLLPLVLSFAGVNLSSAGPALTPAVVDGLTTGELGEAAHRALRGSFTHTLFEWSSVCAAAFVGLLAFVQYRQTHESSLLIIGVALMCAGAMDAFHTLAADRLSQAVASNTDLIPFTWAICRMFNGAIQLIGIGIFVFWAKRQVKLSTIGIVAISTGFVIIAYAIVHYSATSGSLPQTMFPDAAVKRPFDLYPLIPFVLCGVIVFPLNLRHNPTLVAAALALSIIPQIATQLYMAFGSFALHDGAFNIAHSLKIVCYLVPLSGILAQYIQTHSENERAESRLREYSNALEEGSESLEEATCLAEAAAKSKAEFLANMSHEIRTPMTAILGYTDLLMDPDHRETEFENTVQTIKRNGEHLLILINDILDLSKFDAGQMTVERVECSLSQVALDVESLMKVKADAKGLSLGVEQTGAVPRTVLADPTRIRQILINLTGNAIKFTETGEVRIILCMIDPPDTHNPRIKFQVKDAGIGMTEEQLAKIFEPFQQADTSTNRKFGGTGLGLSISARLVKLLDGSVSAESTPGEGSCFSIELPMTSAEDMELIENLDAIRNAKPKPSQMCKSKLANQLNARILLAEDGPDNQRLISFHLKKAGATVEIVENGKIAHDRAMEELHNGTPFDAILMDMQMPVMDGYAATTLLRNEGYSEPIIALTAHAMASDRQKCIDAGCDDYATKPIDRALLFETIQRQLRQHAGVVVA